MCITSQAKKGKELGRKNKLLFREYDGRKKIYLWATTDGRNIRCVVQQMILVIKLATKIRS